MWLNHNLSKVGLEVVIVCNYTLVSILYAIISVFQIIFTKLYPIYATDEEIWLKFGSPHFKPQASGLLTMKLI